MPLQFDGFFCQRLGQVFFGADVSEVRYVAAGVAVEATVVATRVGVHGQFGWAGAEGVFPGVKDRKQRHTNHCQTLRKLLNKNILSHTEIPNIKNTEYVAKQCLTDCYFTVTLVNPMATRKKNQKAYLAAATILMISVLIVGVLASLPLLNNPDASETQYLYQYGGASAVGNFVQTSDGGFAIVGTSSDGNIMVLRLNATKDVEWQKTYGAGVGNAITLSEDGGFAVAATKTTSEGNASCLIMTDAQGNSEWAKNYNGTGFLGIASGAQSGYVLAGSVTENTTQYATLTLVDAAGNVQWSYNYSNSQAQINTLNTLIVTADGGYAATGLIRYSEGETGQYGWFLKVDNNGEVQVNRPYAYEGWTTLNGVAQTADGGYLMVGATTNASVNPYKAFITKTDYDGHPLTSQINGTLNSTGATAGFALYSIAQTADGNYVVGGYENNVGVTIEEISDSGQLLAYTTYSVEEQRQTVTGYVYGVTSGGYAWVGYADGSIWLNHGKPLNTIT